MKSTIEFAVQDIQKTRMFSRMFNLFTVTVSKNGFRARRPRVVFR